VGWDDGLGDGFDEGCEGLQTWKAFNFSSWWVAKISSQSAQFSMLAWKKVTLPTQCPPNEMPHRMFIRVMVKSDRRSE
jgi:hypothetical protein